jgi:DNA repair protein RecN (Recombination protein N)
MKQDNFYIESIILENFATFKNQIVKLGSQFNVIIGETGSGKSLILDALKLILGAKASKSLIRKDCEYSIVEVLFHIKNLNILAYLDSSGYPNSDGVFAFKRIIYRTGKSKTFINGSLTTSQFLASFAKEFIDLVGQFENQKILNKQYQLELLDLFSKHQTQLNSYSKIYQQYKSLIKDLNELENKQANRIQEIDYLKFQLDEIEKAEISAKEEDTLIERKKELIEMSEEKEIFEKINLFLNGSENENGLIHKINEVSKLIQHISLESIAKNDGKILDFIEYFESLSYECSKKLNLEDDEQELQEIADKLDSYQKLKRKFNTDIEGILKIYEEFKEKIEFFDNIEENIKEKKFQLEKIEHILQQEAGTLSKSRHIHAKKLGEKVDNILKNLNMEGSQIDFNLTKQDNFGPNGLDILQIKIQTNPGEGFHDLKDIASGGELSRVLLAIRNIISCTDEINIFLFDEVDTGMGGKTAMLIGDLLAQIAQKSQVIAITHLPQIAVQADHLVKVQKRIVQDKDSKRTVSSAELLSLKNKKDILDIMVPIQ